MPNQDFIRIDGVSKLFGNVRAVDGVSIDIARGEFFALLGPSGCGKTTLLRMLGGFETPASGEIYIDGEPVSGVPPYQRPVNMVFQSYAIFPHLNVFQNIAFGLRKDNLSKPELSSQVNDALSMIRLEGYGDRAADELSGGQRQRVALARALIKRPKVLLLDEPLGALDKKLREQMQLELRDLQRELGITFVFVTHDQEEALTMSDRIAVMSDGKVLETGTPAQLYERPHTRFVSEFLGAMNLFEGRIKETDGKGYVAEVDRLGAVKGAHTDATLQVGDKVTLGLRPENVRLASAKARSSRAAVVGVLGSTAYLGDRTHLYVRVDGFEEPVLAAVQNLHGREGLAGQENTNVSLSWDQSALLMFND